MSLIRLTEPAERDRISQITITLDEVEFAKFHLVHKPSYIGTYSTDYGDVVVRQHYYVVSGALVVVTTRVEKKEVE